MRGRAGVPPSMPGPVKVRRDLVSRLERVTTLSLAAEERLFAQAELMTEGALRKDTRGVSFFGSTIITFDIADARVWLRGLDEEGGADLLLTLLSGSVRVRVRAMRLACAEAARRVPDHDLGTARVEIHMRRDAEKVHLDVDLEARAELRIVGGNA